MSLSENQIDVFYQVLEMEKSNLLNKMKEKNTDEKESRKLNKTFCSISNIQSNLLRLRNMIRPPPLD